MFAKYSLSFNRQKMQRMMRLWAIYQFRYKQVLGKAALGCNALMLKTFCGAQNDISKFKQITKLNL